MSLGNRHGLILAGCIFVTLLVCVPVGRWQGDRAAAADGRRIERIAALAGPLASSRLTAYRLGIFDCLLYREGVDPFAIELCFDTHGRLIEAIDRRQYGHAPKIGSVRYDPRKAPIAVAPARLLAIFHEVGALRGSNLRDGALPGPFADTDPSLTPAANKIVIRKR